MRSICHKIKGVAEQILSQPIKGPRLTCEIIIWAFQTVDTIEVKIIAKIMSTGFDRGVLI